jgi:hypothetical protein
MTIQSPSPQVGEVVDDAPAVGVEKHHFLAGFDGGERLGHGPRRRRAAVLAKWRIRRNADLRAMGRRR